MAEDRIPTLAPLENSAAFDDFEAQLKQQFIEVFQEYIRGPERELNIYGMPHLGSIDLIERHVKRDGLALIRTDDASMKYLYRAWKSRNPKRGFHFLRTYLQLLWPDGWVVEQLWQDKSLPYPTGLIARGLISGDTPHATHLLTSRLRVSVDTEEESGLNIPLVVPALRAVLAAKFVLSITILRRFENIGDQGLGLASAAYGSAVAVFDGEVNQSLYASELAFANGSISNAAAAFTGEAALGSAVIP